MAGIEKCPTCEVKLVESLPAEEMLKAVYAATDPLEANLVKETLLAEEMGAMVISHEDSCFPTHGGQSGFIVAVRESRVERARELLKAAMEEKAFGGAGQLL